MSHFSRIKTQFRNREALIACLEDMAFTVECDTHIRGYRGQQNVDIAARTENGIDIGFLKNRDGSYDMVGDWWVKGGPKEQRLEHDLQERAGKIQQEYARRLVLDQMEKEGFSVVEQKEEEEDGSIRIVVRRWVA